MCNKIWVVPRSSRDISAARKGSTLGSKSLQQLVKARLEPDDEGTAQLS